MNALQDIVVSQKVSFAVLVKIILELKTLQLLIKNAHLKSLMNPHGQQQKHVIKLNRRDEMNKKEEIQQLKQQLKIAKSSCYIAEKALQPFKNCCTMRGARMQLLFEYMVRKDIFVPSEMQSWFNTDKTPKF